MFRMLRLALVAGLLLAVAGCGPAHRHLTMELGDGAHFELTDEFRVQGPAKLEYQSTPTELFEPAAPE